MANGFFNVPVLQNEPVLTYAPGSAERVALKKAIEELRGQEVDIPMVIGGEEIRSENTAVLSPPHDHKHVLGRYHVSDRDHVKRAIQSAMNAKEDWEAMNWEQRASIFLRIADLIAGPYRAIVNASTMLHQSKNAYQAEIDAACELIDFLRFNVYFMTKIYEEQPLSVRGVWNRMEQRPLEGFIFAVTPFNFTAIAGNLPTAPAIMGNTVVWKPSPKQIYSAHFLMQIFREAGLPDGVINLVYDDGPMASEVVFDHPDFGGVHYTGSTAVFKSFWNTIANNMDKYKSYPRIVGETGGKDYVIAHESADPMEVTTALVRGAFEYQGQKCSAVSRAYMPDNLWPEIKDLLVKEVSRIKMGGVEDFTNFVNAVISEEAFDRITRYIDEASNDKMVSILTGGKYDKSKGYFIEPTILVTEDPQYVTMREELFGPVLTIYVYNASRFEEALELVDETSPYGLTGAVFGKDRKAVNRASLKLRHSAGNFYINDKPTGSIVGQQPFGGARASGTNDKAGSMINLLRWVSTRSIKETFDPPTDFTYPFMEEK